MWSCPLLLQRKGAEGNPVFCHGSVASTPHADRETRQRNTSCLAYRIRALFTSEESVALTQPFPQACLLPACSSFNGLHAVTAPLLSQPLCHRQSPGAPPFPRTLSLPAQALSSPLLLSFYFDGVVFYFLKCCRFC